MQVTVVLAEDFGPVRLDAFDEVRRITLERLQASHPETILDILFTSDPRWGAPISAAGQGPAARSS